MSPAIIDNIPPKANPTAGERKVHKRPTVMLERKSPNPSTALITP